MTVALVSETPIREPLQLRPVEDPIERPIEKPVERSRVNEERDAAILAGAAAMLTVLARIVSVRLVLGLTAIGAFALSIAATLNPSVPSLIAMGGFDLLVFVPVVALESGVLTKLRG